MTSQVKTLKNSQIIAIRLSDKKLDSIDKVSLCQAQFVLGHVTDCRQQR